MSAPLRQVWGMVRVVTHLVRGAATMALVFPLIGPTRRRRAVKRWSEGVLEIFGLELQVDGRLADTRQVMLVGNHISWVDIYAYLSVAEMRFVAKSEVEAWPLIGWFAKNLGTIFVVRDRPRDAVRVGNEVRSALDAGDLVCIFPEGTTTDGSVVMPFSSVLLGAAVDKAVPVQPVAISYRQPDSSPCRRAAFTGDATILASIWHLAAGGKSIVRLSFLNPLETSRVDRRTVAKDAEAMVRSSLGHPPASVGGAVLPIAKPTPGTVAEPQSLREAPLDATPGAISTAT